MSLTKQGNIKQVSVVEALKLWSEARFWLRFGDGKTLQVTMTVRYVAVRH